MSIAPESRSRRRPRGQEFRQSPVQAYREGLPGGAWIPPSPVVAECISIASALQAATLLASPKARVAAVEQIAECARPLLPPPAAQTGSRLDPVGVPGAAGIIRALVLLLETDHGHLLLGGHMLHSLSLIYPPETLEGIRVVFALAYCSSNFLEEDLMLARIQTVLRFGRQTGNSELLARAWSGIRTYAQMRGNLPQMERAVRRVVKHAERANDPRLLSLALMQRGVVHGMRAEYAASVDLLWRAYRLTDHDEVRLQILANLAETLYRSGQFQAARAARARVLTLCGEPNFTLVTLGGYAVCCAELGDTAGVTWAARQLLAVLARSVENRHAAQGLLGCADACGHAGLDQLAAELYGRGMAIAERNGYHDLRFKPAPERRREVRKPQPFDGDAELARRSIIELAPDGVSPDMVVVVG